jgi:hypothetical protein
MGVSMQRSFDFSAITTALVLPLLFWSGAVIAISLFGYPGVVCMTPVAWLLALPVGTRVGRSSASPGRIPLFEAAVGGGLLGFWQGLLFAAVMALTPYLPNGGRYSGDLPEPWLVALVFSCLGVPVTAGLAALMAFLTRRRAG